VADPEFLLLGDALWLEFVNTGPGVADRPDGLPDAAAYLRWTKAVRVEAPAAATAFADARRFREQLRALACALEARHTPPASSIEAINIRLAALEGREQLLRIGGAWRLRFAPGRSFSALEAIAHSAAHTLINPLLTVRLCANPECGAFLLDDTPNQSRRWCTRSQCGEHGRFERRRGTRPAPLVPDR
jgi:predicted RNA-binding Zn ribbon-like protein